MTDSSFQTTSWTQVLGAAQLGNSVVARQSLAELCERYWYPLYAYLRRRGMEPEMAEDYVQGFFTELLSENRLSAADPERGRFRAFLLVACKNYVSNQQRAQRAARRGGGRLLFSLDYAEGEKRYLTEPVDFDSPERLFDRRWALETIETALRLLEARYVEQGRAARFAALRCLIAPAEVAPPLVEIAERLGISEGAVKVAAHRLRGQFAAALRDQITATLDLPPSSPESKALVEGELSDLLAALRGADSV